MARTRRFAPTFCAVFRVVLVLAGLAASSPRGGSAQEVSIVGRVMDAVTATPVSGADVSLNNGDARVSTDADGRFAITNLSPGTYSVHIVRLGYEELTLQGIEAGAESAPLEIAVNPAAVALSEIIVSPGTFSFGGSGPTARQTMSRADIDAVPQFAEDIFRAVNRLPGLTSGDFSSRFSIRGGRPDETFIRIDGLEIYEPYHLKDFNDGAISIIDSEVVEGVELMTGGFPVRYGNYTSGVFNINTRDPEVERTRYSLGLSLINARAMAEGTFAGAKGSYFLSARRGYLDLVLKMLGEAGVPSPTYHDVLGKVKYRLNSDHSIALNVLQASDKWTFDAQETTGFLDTIPTLEDTRNRYGNAYVWATHEGLLGERTSVRTIASASFVNSNRDGGEYYKLDGSPLFDIVAKRDFTVFGLRQDWRVDLTGRAAFDFGFDVRALEADYNFRNVVTQDPDNPYPDPSLFFPMVDEATLKPTGSTFGTYLAGRTRVGERLTIELGSRYDRGSYTGDSDFSPRINGLIQLTDATNLRLGWGVFRQMQGIADVSILDPLQQYFRSERSKQLTASLEHIFADGGVLRVEAYHKEGDHLRPVYRNWKAGVDVFPETNEDRIQVHPLSQLSRGIEIYHQRNIDDRLSIRASYALASVEETVTSIASVNDPRALQFAATHNTPRDQRHAVNLDATYRPWLNWSPTTSFVFHTGWPGTIQHAEPIMTEDGTQEFVIVPDPIYGHRLPEYFRIDARLTRRTEAWGGDLRLFFEVSNLTNRTNVFGYDYFRAPTKDGSFLLNRDAEGGFFIVPSLGLSWTGLP